MDETLVRKTVDQPGDEWVFEVKLNRFGIGVRRRIKRNRPQRPGAKPVSRVAQRREDAAQPFVAHGCDLFGMKLETLRPTVYICRVQRWSTGQLRAVGDDALKLQLIDADSTTGAFKLRPQLLDPPRQCGIGLAHWF